MTSKDHELIGSCSGPIEKGASEGQTTYCKDFLANLRREFSGKIKAGGALTTRKSSKRKKKGDKEAGESATAAGPAQTTVTAASAQSGSSLPFGMDLTTTLIVSGVFII